ncbi:hypothetical protein CTI14_51990, partial [Methylobacterium radiotolerans]
SGKQAYAAARVSFSDAMSITKRYFTSFFTNRSYGLVHRPGSARSPRETAEASAQGRIHFGQVISQLAGAGVESYVVDYRSRRTA